MRIIPGSSGNATAVSTFFLSASVSHLSGSPWTLLYSRKLQDCQARQSWCTTSGILFNQHMNAGSFKLAIARKFFRDANLFSINEEPCSIASLTWLSMDRRRTNQSLAAGRNLISTTVALLTGHCVLARRVERMRLPFNDFCRECKCTEEEETVIYFLCECLSLARCRYSLFVSLTLVSMMQLLSIDFKVTASFIKLLS